VTTIAVSILDNEILASEGSTVTLKCPYGIAWEFSIFSEKLHLRNNVVLFILNQSVQ
jgi:hypothetical protein